MICSSVCSRLLVGVLGSAWLVAQTPPSPAAQPAPATPPGPAASQAAPAAPATEPPTVRVARPQPLVGSDRLEAPGRTEPVERAQLFARATGLVRERTFDIGDTVAAGAVMARIDVPEIDAALAVAVAQVAVARADAEQAAIDARRAAELVEARIAAPEEAERRASVAAARAAALAAAEAEVLRLRTLQGFAEVKAPFAGIVAARNFDRGDRVRGDQAGVDGWLYELVRLDELRFVLPAAPELALRLAGAPAPVVHFREFPGRTFPVLAVRASRVFDPTLGTMRVELRLPNVDLLLPAGLTGEAVFELPPLPGGFVVPGNALQLRAGVPTLAIVRDGRVGFLSVATGRTRGLGVEVAHAELSAESLVVVNPNALLRQGDVVRIAEVPAPDARR